MLCSLLLHSYYLSLSWSLSWTRAVPCTWSRDGVSCWIFSCAGSLFCLKSLHLASSWQQVGHTTCSLLLSYVPERGNANTLAACSVSSCLCCFVPVNQWRFSTAWYGTVRYGTVHFWGVFHWVLYLVPDTFLVPLRSRFHASRTVTKTWRVNSADHWLAGENRHYCVTELATRDPPLPLDLNQHSQRRIGRNFCLNKRTFLHQPQNSSVVVCWGRTDVPLVDSRGYSESLMARRRRKKPYVYTFELAIFSEYVFCLYSYLCICVLLQLKTIWSNKCTSRLY